MIFNSLFGVLALSAGFIDGTSTLSTKLLRSRDSNGVEGPSLVSRQDASETCLAAKSIATASFLDGQGKGVNGVAPRQSRSETDKANYIHGCDGKTLTNGLQNKDGSCNLIPMGDIPSFDNMVTTIITSPGQGDDLEANKDFDVKLQVNNLNAGSFTNPQVTYYSAPQRLKNGKIIGHVHVTIQDLKGSLTPNTPPDPTIPAFFKGIDDNGDGKGGLKVTVTGGLPPGFYRICTLCSSSNHQPVIMPVAQRGAQDDCIRVTVGQGEGKKGSNAGGNNQGGNAQGESDQGGNDQGGNAGGNNNGANSDGKGNGGNTAGSNDGASASENGNDNKNGATSNGNNNAGNADGKKDGSNPDGKNGGSKSDGKTNGNDDSNSNSSSNGSKDGSNNVTKSSDTNKPSKPTDAAKSANGNSVIKSDGNKDIAGESKKSTKSLKIDNAADEGGDNGNDGTKTDKINKAATTSTPGSAQSGTDPSGERKLKRFEDHNSHQAQRRGPRPQTRQNMLYMMV